MSNSCGLFVFRVFALVLLLTVLGIPTFGWWLAQRSLPVMDGIISAPGLSRSAMVKYDERAVAYIEGSSDHDLYFAQGYICAAHRMFQMEILRRTATGELSELLGSGSLAEDKLNRTIGFNRLAKDEWKRMSKAVRADLQAYSDGINSYLSNNTGKVSPEFLLLQDEPRKWKPTDSIAILKHRQYVMEESWRLDDLRQRVLDKVGDTLAGKLFNQTFQKNLISISLQPPSVNQIADGLRPIRPVWGSNAWAVAAPLSDSSGALLACDKHGPFTSPDEWFMCSLTSGEIHMAGATIPGVPGIMMGRNSNIAWSGVALRADTQDLLLEQFSPQFPGKYRTASGWENAGEIKEEIAVRFANRLLHKVLITRHGPILSKNETTGVALNWSGADPTTPAIETIWQINRAKNWQDFSAALSHYGGEAQTFVFVDNQGNVGYRCAGNIPIRSNATGSQLMPGWAITSDWKGRAAQSSLPNEFKPGQNFVVADDPAKFAGYNFNNPYRAMRIESVLAAVKRGGQKVGLPDMATLQGDQLAHLAALVKKELRLATTRTEIIDRYQLSALDSLEHWSGEVKPDSSAASIYESFVITLARRALEPKLGTAMTLEYMQRWPRWSVFAEELLTQKPKEWLPPEERTYETFIVTTFSAALKNLKVAGKSDELSKWAWQNFHQATFNSRLLDSSSWLNAALAPIFETGLIGVGGDQDTINACNVVFQPDPWLFTCDSGPTARLLIDMADKDKFYESMPLGQSGHILSANKADQLKSWLDLKPHSIAFSAEQLDKQQQHKLIFNKE